MKLFHNRKFLGILVIVIAFAVCFLYAPAMSKAESRQVSVVRVTKAIPKGKAVTKDMITTVPVGGYNLPSNVVKDEKDAIGKYTLAELDPGDQILTTKLSDKAGSPYLSNLDGKKQAISISIKSFSAGLSGKLQSGDIVQLLVSSYGNDKKTLAPEELRYVKLLAATTEKGTDTDQTAEKKDKNDTSDNDNIPATLTLLVSPAQAEHLVDYETNGKLYATLVYRGDEQSSQKYISIQDDYLSQNGTSSGEPGTSSEGGAIPNGK